MELGTVLLVELNAIFLRQMMSASAYALYAKELSKLIPDIDSKGSISTSLYEQLLIAPTDL